MNLKTEILIDKIENEIRKFGLGTPPEKNETIKVLTGIALLVDEDADPHCKMTMKMNQFFEEIATKVRRKHGR